MAEVAVAAKEDRDIFPKGGGEIKKGFRSSISKIAEDTFNMEQNKFAAQYMQPCKNVANYLQQTLSSEAYLVAKTMQIGRKQIVELLPPINKNTAKTQKTRR